VKHNICILLHVCSATYGGAGARERTLRPSSNELAPLCAPPVFATASSGACMCVCEWCSSALHLPVRVQGGSTAPRVRLRSQRDVQGVRLRNHYADVSRRHVLRKFPCVGGSRSLCAVWLGVVCESRRRTEISWSDAECAYLFWMQGGVPGQFRMSPGNAVVHWVIHRARNFGQAARVDRL